MIRIITPSNTGIYKIAADTFAEMWAKVTGNRPEIIVAKEPSDVPSDGDIAVIGSDASNSYTHSKIIDGTIQDFSIRAGSDDYEIKSADDNGRKILFLAGGRGRALLYAIYEFFEMRACCRYFWDGDIIPTMQDIDLDDLDIVERPRFEYRGLRYFAHRSLDRFQAEHWGIEQWKREIDWLLKKRLNFFMLRIGMDDIFQKAFPDIVDYPEWEVPESVPRSYDDRNLFWPLKYRGELRRQLLQYARERDLMHPEDVGTMTHWYSRTPKQYLEKVKPTFVPQSTVGYSEETGLVWDIRKDENLDAYFKLTETHIREYGSPELFHTIGLAERRCYKDEAANHEMKLYTYRRIIKKLREKYPNAPLLIASWDFSMYWTAEQVRELVSQLNPANTLILDYTSETDDEANCFKNWGVMGRFPWIFGIFHAYESDNEMRGNYDVIARNLPMAAADPMCKGLIYWPEISHSDTLMLEYFAESAWWPSKMHMDISEFLRRFCLNRYGLRDEEMLPIWQAALPLAQARHWSGPKTPRGYENIHHPLYAMTLAYWPWWDSKILFRLENYVNALKKPLAECGEMLEQLANVKLNDEFIVRDVIDIARMAAGRACDCACTMFKLSLEEWRCGKAEASVPTALAAKARDLLAIMLDILSASDEFSLNASLKALQAKHETNPNFEFTLKGNAENGYCRSQIVELVSDIYIPEFSAFADCFAKRIAADDHSPFENLKSELNSIHCAVADAFYKKPLAEMKPDRDAAFAKLPQSIRKLAQSIKELV
ncbi:MAG: hypothetical protein J5833_04215 [Victivallales bacterium]|nr:hypothetical protein [Victivallales bacterium]